jgi:hypothetical protein
LRSEENFAGRRQRQVLEDLSAESEEDIPQEKDARGTVANRVVRAEDESALHLLMKQYGTEERSLIGSERCAYLFGDLPLPPGKGRCNDAKGDALAGDAAEVWNAVEGSVNAGREQRMALLYRVKGLTPLLDGCFARDLCRQCTVGGKVLIEETEQLLKGAEGTEQIAGQHFERLKSN